MSNGSIINIVNCTLFRPVFSVHFANVLEHKLNLNGFQGEIAKSSLRLFQVTTVLLYQLQAKNETNKTEMRSQAMRIAAKWATKNKTHERE